MAGIRRRLTEHYRDAQDFNNLDLGTRGLKPVRCERFGNLIFVNFDDDAPSLLEWLGPIAQEWEEFQFHNCRLAARHIFDLDCNWKIAMEGNTEVYHVRSIHPETVAPILDDRRNVNTLYPVLRFVPEPGVPAQPIRHTAHCVLAERY